jgi:hypothetical protein
VYDEASRGHYYFRKCTLFLPYTHPHTLSALTVVASHTSSCSSLTHSLTHSLILCSLHSYHTTTHPNMHSIRRMLSPSPLSSSLLSLSRQPLRHSLSHTLTRSYTDDSSFHHVTSDQWDLIGKYENELLEWNKKVNLISRKDAAVSGKVMTDHILPCLSISILRPFVPGETVLDAGYVS